jgi:hypothetical protein
VTTMEREITQYVEQVLIGDSYISCSLQYRTVVLYYQHISRSQTTTDVTTFSETLPSAFPQKEYCTVMTITGLSQMPWHYNYVLITMFQFLGSSNCSLH